VASFDSAQGFGLVCVGIFRIALPNKSEKPMKRLSTCLLAGLLVLPQSLWAWSNHTLGSYIALQQLPAVVHAPDVEVEPLESFISQQRAGLVKLLDEQEAYAREHFRSTRRVRMTCASPRMAATTAPGLPHGAAPESGDQTGHRRGLRGG
jgi:hypothetical protein